MLGSSLARLCSHIEKLWIVLLAQLLMIHAEEKMLIPLIFLPGHEFAVWSQLHFPSASQGWLFSQISSTHNQHMELPTPFFEFFRSQVHIDQVKQQSSI